MYGRLTLITVRPGERSKMETLADEAVPLYRQLSGFMGVTFFADPNQPIGTMTIEFCD